MKNFYISYIIWFLIWFLVLLIYIIIIETIEKKNIEAYHIIIIKWQEKQYEKIQELNTRLLIIENSLKEWELIDN